MLRAAAAHRGSAFVEIFQNCNIYNDGAFDDVRENEANRIYLHDGESIRFGAEHERGVRLRPDGSCEVVDVAEVGEEKAKTLVAARDRGGRFADVRDLAQRSTLPEQSLESLVASGACDSFDKPRRGLLWELGLVPRSQPVPGSARYFGRCAASSR